jgi:tRNA threonylcarbamoyladenosine biosynthesis protein TsaB
MAYLLHIETSTEKCGVALSFNEKFILEKEVLEKGFTHAKKLHVLIQELLIESKVSVTDLKAVAVSQGPGSFTGLRIGCVAAKGLCFALEIPLISLPTLEILAAPYWNEIKVVSLLDARRSEAYTAIYSQGGELLKDTHAHILTKNSFSDLANEKVLFVGTGAKKAKDILLSNSNWNFNFSYPSAAAMPTLALQAKIKNEFQDINTFTPTYLKPVRITESKKDALGRKI